MLDLTSTPDAVLDPISRVVEAVLTQVDALRPDEVMVVGAWCRDILHRALRQPFATTATRDLDLALALSSWDAYSAIAAAFLGSATPAFASALPTSTSTCSPSATSKTLRASPNRRREAKR